MAKASTITADDEGPFVLKLQGHFRELKITGQDAINEIIRKKIWGVVDSEWNNPAPHITITIKVDPDR